MEKSVYIDKRAVKEIKKFPSTVQAKFYATFKILAADGKLIPPYGKKIDHELLEIRIIYKGHWRGIYAYQFKNTIIVLSAFQKKTRKTPITEISKAKNRLKGYKNE